MELCRLENASKSYFMGEEIRPFKNLCFTVNTGDFIAVEGPSGIGKSTLLYVMGSLLMPDEGQLYLQNKNAALLTERELTLLRAKSIGFIFQDTALIRALTIKENLEFAQTLGKTQKAEPKKIAQILQRLGLEERQHFLPHQISGGQRRRASVACGLIKNPALILADEPTNDLDDAWAEEVIGLFREASDNGSAVVMVTHNKKWSAAAKTIYDLNDGRLQAIS